MGVFWHFLELNVEKNRKTQFTNASAHHSVHLMVRLRMVRHKFGAPNGVTPNGAVQVGADWSIIDNKDRHNIDLYWTCSAVDHEELLARQLGSLGGHVTGLDR